MRYPWLKEKFDAIEADRDRLLEQFRDDFGRMQSFLHDEGAGFPAGDLVPMVISKALIYKNQCDKALADVENLIQAAKEWKESNLWAALNPEKMLSSVMTTEEAGEVMDNYFSKEEALMEAVDEILNR